MAADPNQYFTHDQPAMGARVLFFTESGSTVDVTHGKVVGRTTGTRLVDGKITHSDLVVVAWLDEDGTRRETEVPTEDVVSDVHDMWTIGRSVLGRLRADWLPNDEAPSLPELAAS
jgi:hypothetical protein